VFFIWGLCTAVALVPSPLIEFRYYTLPWLFLQFEIKPFGIEVNGKSHKVKDKDRGDVSKEKEKEKEMGLVNRFVSSLYPLIIAYIMVDIATVYIFLYKPFNYGEEVGRFMW
jgi:hypothetical protein